MNGEMNNGSNARIRRFDFSANSLEAQDAESRLDERNEQTKAHSKGIWEDFKQLAEKCTRSIEEEEDARGRNASGPPFPGHDICVTALGTGSAMPSKYRNG